MASIIRKVKPPRCVRMLEQYGESAFRPDYTTGRYAPPLIPRKTAAKMRKQAIIDGTFGSYAPGIGGWDPAWDIPKKVTVIKPNKGHVHERNRPERANKITKAMEGMPAKIEKYYQEMADRRPKKDILYMFKRAEDLSGGKGGRR